MLFKHLPILIKGPMGKIILCRLLGINRAIFLLELQRNLPAFPGGEPDPIRESQESIESDDSLHTSLLIETMAQEMEHEKVVEVTRNCDSALTVTHAYKVESPEAEMVSEGLPTLPLVTQENLRFSLRNL